MSTERHFETRERQDQLIIDRLQAENVRLRAALEAAPPPLETLSRTAYRWPNYADWFNGARAEALLDPSA